MYEFSGQKFGYRDALMLEHPPKPSIAEANQVKDEALVLKYYGPNTFGAAKDIFGPQDKGNVFKPAGTFMNPHDNPNPNSYNVDYSEAVCTIM